MPLHNSALWWAWTPGADWRHPVVVLGLKGWLAPKGWQGGLPPISLVAVSAALVPLLVKRKLVHEKRKREERTQ